MTDCLNTVTASNRQTETDSTIGTRIHVIGNSASGKSTLGARLAQALDAAFVELDACLTDPRWAHIRFVRLRSSREVEEFARRLRAEPAADHGERRGVGNGG